MQHARSRGLALLSIAALSLTACSGSSGGGESADATLDDFFCSDRSGNFEIHHPLAGS